MNRTSFAGLGKCLCLIAVATLLVAGNPPAGEKAPELTPTTWMNIPGVSSWEHLRGQVVLIEKWATW